MFLLIILGLFLIILGSYLLLSFTQRREHHLKYGGVYTKEGTYFFGKYYLFLLVLLVRKFRVNHWQIWSCLPKVFDMDLFRKYREMEEEKTLPEEDSIDSVYFFMHSPVGEEASDGEVIDLAVRLARRRNQKHELWIWLTCQSNGGIKRYVRCELTSDGNLLGSRHTWSHIAGLRIKCVQPMECWRILYSGWMTDEDTHTQQHVTFKLNFRAFTNIVDSHKDTSCQLSADAIAREPWSRSFFTQLAKFKETKQTHYEQFGSYDGLISIGRRDPIIIENGKGYRDHSYGLRNWSQYRRYGTIFGYLENGSVISLGSVCCDSVLSHVRYGYYITPYGSLRPITQHNYNLWQVYITEPPNSDVDIEFYTGSGDKFHLTIKPTNETKFVLNQSRTRITERFVHFQLDGVNGWGVNEFCTSETPSAEYISTNNGGTTNRPVDLGHQEDINQVHCIDIKSKKTLQRQYCGGKAAQLSECWQIIKASNDVTNISIPAGFVVTTYAYNLFIQNNKELLKKIKNFNLQKHQDEESCIQLQKEFCKGVYPEELLTSITEMMQELLGPVKPSSHVLDKQRSFAVRSSATHEDGETASSAGQMLSLLGVSGKIEAILDGIKQCWASLYSYTAVCYRTTSQGHLIGNPQMGVVVMEMVDAHTAGVMFTADPYTGDHARIIINAAFGIGESVVCGELEPDTIILEKQRSISNQVEVLEKIKGAKATSYRLNQDGEMLQQLQTKDEICMTDAQFCHLGRMGLQIEQWYGEPRDVEWAVTCIDSNDVESCVFYILQSRPITSIDMDSQEDLIHEFDSAISNPTEALTTANIGEMMPQAVTPLTLSLMNIAIDRYFQVNLIKSGLMQPLDKYVYPRRFQPSFCNHMFINFNTLALMTHHSPLKTDLQPMFIALIGRHLSRPNARDIDYFSGPHPSSISTRMKVLYQMLFSSWGSVNKAAQWEERLHQDSYYTVGRDPLSSRRLFEDILARIEDYYNKHQILG